jgi:hypothetical protein
MPTPQPECGVLVSVLPTEKAANPHTRVERPQERHSGAASQRLGVESQDDDPGRWQTRSLLAIHESTEPASRIKQQRPSVVGAG